MRFAIYLTLCLFFATSFATNVDTLQQMYNGYFEEAGLADPTTIMACYDENSAGLTVTFISTILEQLANYDVFDIDTTVKNYESQLPDSVKTCTNGNAEFQNVQKAYNMTGLTLDQIESQVANYAFQNLAKVHNEADSALTAFQADNFDEVGKQGGKFAKLVFGSSSAEKVGDAQDDLQLLANGFWEQAGLSDPTSLDSCFDENSANITVTFVGAILNDLANSNIKGAEADLEAFEQNLPASTKSCVTSNPEITQVLQAYNIYGLNVQQLESKVESYALWHMIALHHDAVIANDDFTTGNYKAVGQEGGYILQAVFGKNSSAEAVIGAAIDDLQTMAIGFWVQAGLTDPTTITQCFDESSANLTLTFIGNVLEDIAKNNINKAQSDASTFAKNLPKAVQDCVKENKEFQQVLQAYKVAGLTTQQIENKVKSYALLHYVKLHQYTIVANSDFQDGNYKNVGKEGGVIIQSIFGKSEEEVVGDSIADLQLLANGFWEKAGLSDPTTVTNCFDLGSANLTVTFIGNLLNALANSNVKGAETDLVTFNNSLPETVKTCLAGNYETTTVLQKYKIYGLTIQQLESKIESYAVWHMLQLHHDAVIANDDFQNGNYKAVGQEGGSIIQNIFGSSETNEDDTDYEGILQQYFNGFFEQANLTDPTTIINDCFVPQTAQILVEFIANVVGQLANKQILAAESTSLSFLEEFPKATQQCIYKNAEFQQAAKAYGIVEVTPVQMVEKVVAFAFQHGQQLAQYTTACNQAIQASNYDEAGKVIGQGLQAILPTESLIPKIADAPMDDPLQDLTGLLDGFWENVNLPDPTSAISCFDETNAQVALTFVSELFSDLANDNLLDLPSAISSFEKNISPSVMSCLKGSPDIQSVGQAYGVTGVSTATLVSKVAKYALLHAGQFHTTAVQLNTDYSGAQYDAAGRLSGQLLQAMLSSTEKFLIA